MNIVDILEKLTKKLNDQKKCDLCWKYIFGGRQDYLNLSKLECLDECCVHICVYDLTYRNINEQSGQFTRLAKREWRFKMFVGYASRLDIAFYNETNQPKHSKWEAILYPLFCCFNQCDIDICDIANACCCDGSSSFDITQWEGSLKLNFLDNNFDGWLYNVTIVESLS